MSEPEQQQATEAPTASVLISNALGALPDDDTKVEGVTLWRQSDQYYVGRVYYQGEEDWFPFYVRL